MRRVTVTWIDVLSSHGWESFVESARMNPVECRTTGYLLRQDETAIVVASTIGVEGYEETNCRMSIPAGLVKHIEYLDAPDGLGT